MRRRTPDSKKMPSSIETEEFLRKARDFRRDLIAYSQKWPTISGARNSTDAVQRTIDDLAWVLTGDREHFWTRPHSTL